MEKSSSLESDLEDWELLHDDHHAFLNLGHGCDGRLFSNDLIDFNYFICPLESQTKHPTKENALEEEFKDIGVVPPVIVSGRDAVSQVFFRKNEFVDMKLDSPMVTNKSVVAPVEFGMIPFSEEEEEEEEVEVEVEEKKVCECEDWNDTLLKKETEKVEDNDVKSMSEKRGKGCMEGFGITIWRWRITGVGALCSIGVAAATLCIIILGGRQQPKQQQQQQQHQSQKLQFQIYGDNKSVKQVVAQAARLNQALATMRDAPAMMARAHVSFGGYYDAL